MVDGPAVASMKEFFAEKPSIDIKPIPVCEMCKKNETRLTIGSKSRYNKNCDDCNNQFGRVARALVRAPKMARKLIELESESDDEGERYTMKQYKQMKRDVADYGKNLQKQFEEEFNNE